MNGCGGGGGGGNGSAVVTPPITAPQIPTKYTIGGTITGLPNGANVVLKDTVSNAELISENGSYTFSTSLDSGSTYAVKALTVPNNYSCTVSNSSGTIGSSISTVNIQCALVSPFSSNAILLPDVRQKYDRLCGDAVGMRAFTANMIGHKDGKKDIVATFYCVTNPVGQTLLNSVPTKNGLIVFLQRNDGTFYDGTLDIFGVDLVDLGGISFEHPAVFDINGDGYDEIVLPITGEDGRALLSNDTTTWNNKQVVFITSIGSGQYKVEKIGWASYGMAADLVDNQFNSKDVITTVIGYGGKPQAWRLNGANWNLATDYDSLGNSLTGLYFPGITPSSGSASHLATTSVTSIALYQKANGNWSKSSDWSFQNIRQAQYVSWNGQQGALNLINYNGADYGFVSFGEYCALRRNSNENYFGFYELPSSLITGGYNGQLLHESSTDFQTHILLMGFSIANGNITQINIPFQNEISNQMPLKMTCNDVNGSGNQAITILTWGQNAKPIVYLNNNNGGFSSVNQNVFPSASISFDGNTSILEDIDGDGIPDLFVYPLNGLRNSPASVKYQIFKGIRVLGSTDLN